MTTKTNEVEEYKKGLSDICKMSGIGMCPGCGLTPEGLEKLTALEVEYEKKEAYAQGWNEGQQALKEETALAVEKEQERIGDALQRINELTDESCRNGLDVCPKCASLELVRRKLTPQ